MNRIFMLVFVFAIFSSESFAQNLSSKVLIGIMEDDRQELVNWEEGPSKNRVILPLFEKENSKWIPAKSHSEDIFWTMTFDGKNIGSIKGIANNKKSNIYKQTQIPIRKKGHSLTIGKPAENFSGWQDTLVNRPVVLVYGGNYKDQDGWKPYKPAEKQIVFFKSIFKKEYPKVETCDENEEPLKSPWGYTNKNIIISKVYKSNKNDYLVEMSLDGGNCGVNDGPFQAQIFLIKDNKYFSHIVLKDRKGHADDNLSLILLDAGDYDNDGKSEVVFFVSGYNEDGYAMFYDSFKKHIVHTWNYH